MKEEMSSSYLKQIRTVLVLGIVILVLFVLKATSEVTLPVAFALFLFAFVNPLMETFAKLKIPNAISIILIMVLVVSIFLVVG